MELMTLILLLFLAFIAIFGAYGFIVGKGVLFRILSGLLFLVGMFGILFLLIK